MTPRFPSIADRLVRFVAEALPVRGAIAHLDGPHREVLSRHAYPPRLRVLLGELLAASVLLASTLKFRGMLTAQVQSPGTLRLLVVDCSDALEVRAMAKWDGAVGADADLAELTGDDPSSRRLVITIDPADAGQMYQGIVEVAAGSISGLLEHYLSTSEQLPSRLWLAANDDRAAGMLLQRLPGAGDDDEGWHRMSLLAGTLRDDELLGVPPIALLQRLFVEETIRVFPEQPIRFACPCSAERVAGALRLLGRAEVESLIEEQGSVSATCEFCNREYRFAPADALALVAGSPVPENLTRH
jgi:molecular chaperone Hsp33